MVSKAAMAGGATATILASDSHEAMILVGLPGLLAILVMTGVVLPAVWSSKRSRRRAALEVLDTLMRWTGSDHRKRSRG